MPWGEVRNLFDHCYNSLEWSEASYLSMEQKRRREQNSSLPQEHYDIASTKHRFQDERSKEEIDCRVIFVYSTADQKVAAKQRSKQIDRIRRDLEKCQNNVARRGPYSDEQSVRKRMDRLFGKSTVGQYFTGKWYRFLSLSEPNTK